MIPSPQPCAWACCLSCLPLSRTPVFSVQSQGNFLPCHLSQGPGGWACQLQLCSLFIPSSRGAPLPYVLGLWEWWPTYPVPKAKNTKYLLSPQHLCPPLPAVASVYREISYWPCHSTLLPSVHGIPGPPPASLLSSGTAQALNHPVPSGGIFQAPSSGTRASQKGFLDLFAWSWRD